MGALAQGRIVPCFLKESGKGHGLDVQGAYDSYAEGMA